MLSGVLYLVRMVKPWRVGVRTRPYASGILRQANSEKQLRDILGEFSAWHLVLMARYYYGTSYLHPTLLTKQNSAGIRNINCLLLHKH